MRKLTMEEESARGLSILDFVRARGTNNFDAGIAALRRIHALDPDWEPSMSINRPFFDQVVAAMASGTGVPSPTAKEDLVPHVERKHAPLPPQYPDDDKRKDPFDGFVVDSNPGDAQQPPTRNALTTVEPFPGGFVHLGSAWENWEQFK